MLRRGTTLGGSPPWISWWPLVILVLLAAAAAVPRLLASELVYVTRDESFSWRMIQYPPGELIERTAADVHPPLYYLALQVWSRAAGSTIAALRAMSALAGVAGVVAMYLLVLEACRFGGRQASGSRGWMHFSALLAAALLALHPLQVDHGRTARMYSLGVFLAVLSSWLLLRALRSPRAAWWRRWSGFALVAALFCYTHNFALFTLAATGLFVGGLEMRRWAAGGRRQALRELGSFAAAVLVAALLFAPWVPVLWRQAATVREGFWIAPPHAAGTATALASWATGLTNLTATESGLALAALAVLIATTLVWRDRAAYLLLAQAALPWIICLAVSRFSDTSIFQLRYLAFAHAALIALVGMACFRLRAPAPRWMLAWCVGALSLVGLYQRLSELPRYPPAIAMAMRFVERHAQADDVVLASSQRTVNQVRYYAEQAGLQELPILCVMSPHTAPGHVVHLAALEDEDVVSPERWRSQRPPGRLWSVYDAHDWDAPLPSGRERLVQRRFVDSQGLQYVVTLWQARG